MARRRRARQRRGFDIILVAAMLWLLPVSVAASASKEHYVAGTDYHDSFVEFGFTQVPKEACFDRCKFYGGAFFWDAEFDSAEASFNGTHFWKRADFVGAKFHGGVSFMKSVFDSSALANFPHAHFWKCANFDSAQFHGGARFWNAIFDTSATAFFGHAQFSQRADFEGARFQCGAFYFHAEFHTSAGAFFHGARFWKFAVFSEAEFRGGASFDNAKFFNGASFEWAILGDSLSRTENARASYRNAETSANLVFSGAQVFLPLDFQGVRFVSELKNRVYGTHDSGKVDLTLEYLTPTGEPWAIFHNARLYDTIHVGTPGSWEPQDFVFSLVQFPRSGSWEPQNFDFSLAQFRGRKSSYPWDMLPIPMGAGIVTIPLTPLPHVGPAIIVYGPIRLKMQEEKFDYLHLYKDLSYFEKKNIIEYLKSESYAGSEHKRERFELDYLLARAVAFQKVSTAYETYKWYDPRAWVIAFRCLSLGYGYRPFRLLWWVGGIALLFAVLYSTLRKGNFAEHIGRYVRKLDAHENESVWEKWGSRPEAFYYCLWFSVVVLLAIRIKPRLLVSFNTWEKRFILTEYVIGLLLYTYFIMGSQAGSLASKFVELFTG